MPLVAGWLSDRVGRRPVIIGVYVGGAVAFVAFLLAGSSLVALWIGILLMGLFTFAESPQLQALLADVADPRVRDASFALYFTLAFGVGSLWTFLYGRITDGLGDVAGLPIVFIVMAVSFVLAALAVIPIHEDPVAGRVPQSP
jgi:AAHS family 3-hydroxyphenylpropionic acid transporter